MGKDKEPRSSGILNPEEQLMAQDLYDLASKNEGETVMLVGKATTISALTSHRAHRNSVLVLTHDTFDMRNVTMRLRKGRNGWQDDGSEGYVGWFGEGSKVEPERVHPDSVTRDRILFEVAHDVFIAPQTPTNS